MEYRIVRTGENKDYLEHAIHGMGKRTYSGTSQKSNGSGGGSDSGGTGQGRGRQKGFQLDNHLYLARQWVGDKWRYAYNQAEVKAMQNWGKAKKAAGDVADAAKGAAGTAKKVLSGNYSKDIDSSFRKTTSALDKARKRGNDVVEDRLNKKVANLAKQQNTNAYKVSDTVEKATNKARDAAKSASDYVSDKAGKVKNTYEKTKSNVSEYVSDKAGKAKTAVGTAKKVLSGNYSKDIDSSFIKTTSALDKARKRGNDVVEDRLNKKVANLAKQQNTNAYKVSDAVEKATNKARDVAKSTSDYVSDKADKAKTAASDTYNNAKDKISNAYNATKSKVENEINDPRSITNRAKNAVSNIGWEAAEGAKKAGKAVADYTADKANKAKNVYEKARSDAGDLLNQTLSSAKSKVDKGKDAASKLLDKATDKGKALKETTMKAAQDAAEKGKGRVDQLLSKASKAASDAPENLKDLASRTYGKAKTQVELAKNASTERDYDRFYKNWVKDAEKKVSNIEKEIAEYNKLSKEEQDFNAGWYRMKQEQLKTAKDNLNDAKEQQKEWNDNDKTLWRDTDKVSDMNPNMKVLEPVTSSARKSDIKEQNLYKYDKQYREDSDRASYLGSYLDNWDKNGGPKTAEGRANYQKMLRELNALEARLDAKRK